MAFQGLVIEKEPTDNSSQPAAQAPVENEPLGDKSQVAKQTDVDLATQLGRATHERMSAIDHLPKFYITSNNVRLVEKFFLEDPSDDSLDNLIRSLDLDTRGKRFGQSHDQFGWDENHFLIASGDNDQELKWYWGTREIAGTATNSQKPRGRSSLFGNAQQAWAQTFDLTSNYMIASRHTFWFGASRRWRSFARNCIPANLANYQQLADMKFDGEMCQVVRTVARQEMLIISKASGLLRGYVVIRPKGVSPFRRKKAFYAWADSGEPEMAIELRSALKNIAEVDFKTKLEFSAWYRKNEVYLSVQQKWKLEAAVLASLDWTDPTPTLLVRFRDYREIAPGILWPFREDLVESWGAKHEGKLMSERSYSDVERIRVDKDLANKVSALRPKEGDEVAEVRFATLIRYNFSQDRTNEELLKVVDIAYTEKMKDKRTITRLKMPFEDMLDKPAPILPAKNWVGGDRPILDGKPYLIHFWATWHEPCENDFPILKQLAEAGATVVGVHPVGTNTDDFEEAIKAANLPYPTHILPFKGGIGHLVDDYPTIATVYPRTIFPYCVLVNSKGQVVAHGGLTENDYALLRKFRSLITATDKGFKWKIPES